MDLDQAVHIARADDGLGYLVHYAIADVASWVRPGGPIDRESWERGQTLYSPDLSTPLHPRRLSESAGSLLPDQRRPAVLWTIALDATGEVTDVSLSRVEVRSVARLDYPGVQADVTAGTLHPSIELLPDVGKLRQGLARQRHALTLDLPDVEIVRTGGGRSPGWNLELRALTDVEAWNAEISLLTGMCAARIMLDGRVGILRTLPDPSDKQIAELRRATAALGIPWPDGVAPGDVVAQLDPAEPRQAAFLEYAVKLLRGADYHPFDRDSTEHPTPERTGHAGIGAPYAHVTAPLRRLVDRYGTEICLALHAGRPVPDWARDRLGELPGVMGGSAQRAAALEKACIGAVGAFLLAGREGDVFTATVLQVERDKDRARLVLDDPPVRATCPADGVREGEQVRVVLVASDPATHTYTVRLADRAAAP
jgi:exoribonuclease R